MSADYNYDTSNPFGEQLAYDLRVIYAKIVGEHLEDVAEARRADNYSAYYNSLKDLFTIIRHKFKKPKEDMPKYKELIKEAITIANKYPDAFLGKVGNDSQEAAEVEDSLRAIEMFLYDKMNDANMFGSKRETEGLV